MAAVDLGDPARVVVPSLDRLVLTVLAGTSRPLTGREVARLARSGSQSGVQRILTRLAEHGLAQVLDAGSARLYTLNREHVAAPAVVLLTDLRGELFARIRTALAGWAVPPVAAAVFGSAARGDGDTDSDIDLFLVRPPGVPADDRVWGEQVAELASRVRAWSGNSASIIQATPRQVTAMVRRREPVVAELRRDQVPLTETDVLPVLSGAA